jgi:pantetheine-phosphate adenylyltransferase
MAGMKRVGLYPGTFDPLTNGHLDIIRRAVKLVDHLVIGVAINAAKGPIFTIDERVSIVEQETSRLRLPEGSEISVKPFDSLLMHFAEDVGAQIIIRGLRAVSDFEYEFQMVGMNDKLNPEIETVFLMAEATHQAIASRLVKEIATLGGDVTSFVSPFVAEKLLERIGEKQKAQKKKG